ncbi:branched-chain amino acid ABC transporter permease [Tissierella sp.]|uniref:branched-chain amino acid ABC transporter permease n=1 Tax=Tissierella sp. TaxID=41274 RepID=UPI002855B3CE|nr:branched-chain amino acid ABC transporter permease [Tissierella sp.]MDR7857003.1 branched-chain amino acid ABC transporter permease [Tissierella sp.]
MKENKLFRNLLLIGIVIIALIFTNLFLDNYKVKIINLCAIYIILGLSMNLINGFTGLFSLGHAGFMAIGAYTVAILTMPVEMKEMNFYMKPMLSSLLNLNLPFILALLMGGLMAAIFGFLIGAPVLKLTDDYLAIATLGFSEIIRIVFINLQSITNGSLGLKGIPQMKNDFIAGVFNVQAKPNILWAWGAAILTIVFINLLMKGSYGKAFKAIREDEIAARSMGINLFKHKVLSFTIGSFLAGIGGGLLAVHLGTIDPASFKFALTFNILLIVVLGGMGNITGTVVSAIIITVSMEALRFLDGPMNFGFFTTSGLPGLRMVVFSLILMLVIIFKKDGFVKNALTKVRGKYAKN